MNSIKTFNYQGSSVTFQIGDGDVMVNASEMVRAFPTKRTNDFTSLKQTQEFVDLLKTKTEKTVLTVNHGGSNPGTWFHQKLALKFAAWLSPEFELWVYDRIEELMKYGFTASHATIEEIINNPDHLIKLATALKEERAAKETAQETAKLQAEQLRIVAPKVEYCNQVLQADNTHTTTTIAKELGMSGKALHKQLNERGIMYHQDGHWVLYSKYQGLGFTKTRTHTYEVVENDKTVTKTSISTVWTEKGRAFLHKIFRPVVATV